MSEFASYQASVPTMKSSETTHIDTRPTTEQRKCEQFRGYCAVKASKDRLYFDLMCHI